MKKLAILIVFVLLGTSSSYSQGDLKLGFNAGIPTGDIGEVSDLQVGLDAAYLINILGLAEIGPMVGYSHFLREDGIDNVGLIPIAASGRLNLPIMFMGLDLGYGLSTQDGGEGGVYYRPKIGFGIALVNIIASYSGISVDGGNRSSINLGIELSL